MFVLIYRPLVNGATWWAGGTIIGSFFSSGVLRLTLYIDSFFVLGPLGAARGLLSATRTLIVDSGMAEDAGRAIYDAALDAIQRISDIDGLEEDGGKPCEKKSLRDAIQGLRESYPWGDAFISGDGFFGWLSRSLTSIILPGASEIFDQIDLAIEWSEGHEEDFEDAEVVAKAASNYVDVVIEEKMEMVSTVGMVMYTVISVAGLTLNCLFSSVVSPR